MFNKLYRLSALSQWGVRLRLSRPVILNIGPAPHQWGMAKIWWCVEIEDIMKQFWLKCKMKSRLFTIQTDW